MVDGKSLGLIMIVRDEEANLGRSLLPVIGLFDQAVVVDTGSRDRTRELAREAGAEVVDYSWRDDFAEARNVSIKASRTDYLFWLDGDNAVAPRGVEVMRRAVEEIDRPFIGWGTEVLVPRGERLIQKRLFPRRRDIRFKGRIHEQLDHPEGLDFIHLGVEISHWGYEDPAQARAKGERNLDLLLDSLKRDPQDFFLLYQAGKTLLNLKRPAEAEPYLARAAGSDRGPAENPELWAHGWVLWAGTAERAGDPGTAKKRLGRGLEATSGYPDQALIRFHLGRMAGSAGDWPDAVVHLTAFLASGYRPLTLDLDLDRMESGAAIRLARALDRLGRGPEAVARLRWAVEVHPGNPLIRRELITQLGRTGQSEAAREEAEKLLAGWPEDPLGRKFIK